MQVSDDFFVSYTVNCFVSTVMSFDKLEYGGPHRMLLVSFWCSAVVVVLDYDILSLLSCIIITMLCTYTVNMSCSKYKNLCIGITSVDYRDCFFY